MRTWLFSALACVVAVACAAGSDEDGLAGGESSGNAGSSGVNIGGGGTSSVPPEQETEATFRVPVVSGRWVWTANPDTGRVALIDTETLRVTTADAELEPTYLAPLASSSDEESGALVLNVGTDTVSVMHASSGVIESRALPVHHGANALKVSATSQRALIWTDAALIENPDPTEGFQDVTVLTLGDHASSRRLTVGYRPSRVFIAESEERAFVVAEATISVIDLSGKSGPEVLRDVALASDPDEAALARDVSITPDGAFALVRHEGKSTIDVIDLATGEKTTVTLPGPVTDLDLAPDASRAFAVVRGQATGADAAAGAGGNGAAGVAGDTGTATAGAGATAWAVRGALAAARLPVAGVRAERFRPTSRCWWCCRCRTLFRIRRPCRRSSSSNTQAASSSTSRRASPCSTRTRWPATA